MKPIYFSQKGFLWFSHIYPKRLSCDFPSYEPLQKIFARSTPSSWPTAPFWVGRQWRASGLVPKFEEIAKESWRMMKIYVTFLFNMFAICLHHFFWVWYVCTIFRLIYIFFQSSIDQDGASQIQLEKLDVLDISLSLPPRSSMTPDRKVRPEISWRRERLLLWWWYLLRVAIFPLV